MALGLAGCGGGGGSNVRPTPAPPPPTVQPLTITGTYDVDFDNKPITWSSKTSGTGHLVKDGTGTLIITGALGYTGGTTINAGMLVIGNGGTTGSITGDITDNAQLAFSRSDGVIFHGVISGSGSLSQWGTGTLTLTAANTYTGGTMISAGTIILSSGSQPGTGPVDVDSGTLEIEKGAIIPGHIKIAASGVLDNMAALSSSSSNALISGRFGKIINHHGGTITGTSLAITYEGGTITNDGIGSTISAPQGTTIDLPGNYQDELVNNIHGATVSGATKVIEVGGGGFATITNGTGSTIQATNADGDAIFADKPGDPSSGTGSANLTITNSGTIIGNVDASLGTANATLSPGSVIQGDLALGNYGSLSLIGDAGTVGVYSHAVTGSTTGDEYIHKQGDGKWIIDTDLLSPATVGNSGFGISIDGGILQLGNGGTEGLAVLGQTWVTIHNGTLAFDFSNELLLETPSKGLRPRRHLARSCKRARAH
ncbi:MAG TPA: autotransporter-associated beta strand repeat-containing protein [Rhodanobacteraceae bacterium]